MKTQGQNCLPPAWVYWLCSPDVTRQMGFSLGISPYRAPWWVGSIVNETQTFFMAYENINQAKNKDPFQNPLQKVNTKLMKTSINSLYLNQLKTPQSPNYPHSWFKNNKPNVNQSISKKLWTTPLLYKQIKNNQKILKWKQFGKLNINAYPHSTLNFLKEVFSLSFCRMILAGEVGLLIVRGKFVC